MAHASDETDADGIATVVSSQGAQIAYSVEGGGDRTLMLIHGWCCSAEFWFNQTPRTLPGWRIAKLDLAGHGRSTAGLRNEWSMATFADDILAVHQALGAPPTLLVGHSMGGPVAIEAAKRLNGDSLGVVAVDSFTYESIYGRVDERTVAKFLAPFIDDFHGALIEFGRILFLPGADHDFIDWVMSRMAQTSPVVAVAAFRALLLWDRDESLSTFEGRPIVISSAPFLSQDADAKYAETLSLMPMEDVGHFPMLDAPDRFSNALMAAITRLTSSPRKS